MSEVCILYTVNIIQFIEIMRKNTHCRRRSFLIFWLWTKANFYIISFTVFKKLNLLSTLYSVQYHNIVT